MRIAIAKEYLSWERRVAVTPTDAARLSEAGLDVFVQAGAGESAAFTDRAYRMAGATVVDHVAAETIDLLAHVRPIHPAVLPKMRRGTYTVGVLRTEDHPDINAAMRATGVNGVALEHLGDEDPWHVVNPLAAGDVLFGQAIAASSLASFDGNVAPFVVPGCVLPAAKVLILGASVAGLAAAQNLRKAGARTTVVDTDPSAAAHVAAVAADYLEVSGSGRQRRERLAAYIADADIVIAVAAAADTGKPLFDLDEALITRMRPGSVVVEATNPWTKPRATSQLELPTGGHVTVLRPVYGTHLATAGSRLFSATLTNFVIAHTADGRFVLDPEADPSVRQLLRPAHRTAVAGTDGDTTGQATSSAKRASKTSPGAAPAKNGTTQPRETEATTA